MEKKQVYLDVTHLEEKTLHKLEAILEIYQKFTGENPRKVPMKIFPAVHYSMGGMWVDWPATGDEDRFSRYRQMTNLTGLLLLVNVNFNIMEQIGWGPILFYHVYTVVWLLLTKSFFI